MLIYAHRGASAQYPENTMLAFEKAVEMGAAGIETDVHLSRDGQLVLCHDETIDGTTDRSGWIARLTYDELLRADAGVRRGAQFAGQRIPLLRDLLKLARESGIALNLELKNYVLDYPDLERLVIEEIRKYLRPERVLLSSFRHLSLVRAKQMAPEPPRGSCMAAICTGRPSTLRPAAQTRCTRIIPCFPPKRCGRRSARDCR